MPARRTRSSNRRTLAPVSPAASGPALPSAAPGMRARVGVGGRRELSLLPAWGAANPPGPGTAQGVRLPGRDCQNFSAPEPPSSFFHLPGRLGSQANSAPSLRPRSRRHGCGGRHGRQLGAEEAESTEGSGAPLRAVAL